MEHKVKRNGETEEKSFLYLVYLYMHAFNDNISKSFQVWMIAPGKVNIDRFTMAATFS